MPDHLSVAELEQRYRSMRRDVGAALPNELVADAGSYDPGGFSDDQFCVPLGRGLLARYTAVGAEALPRHFQPGQ